MSHARVVPLLILGLVGLAAGAEALDPAKKLTQYTRSSWHDELPQTSVRSILQTRDGYMWFGTFEGLARFDGVSFTVFDRSRTRDLLGTAVNHLLEDEQGDLWISTNGGLTRRRNGVFRTFTTIDGLPNDLVNSTHLGEDSSLWIATDTGLAVLQGGVIRAIASGGGETPPDAREIELDDSGDVWITSSRGVYRFRGHRYDHFTTRDGLPNDSCWALLKSRDGSLWIGTDGGLVRYHRGHFTSLTTRDGLPDPFVRSLFEDRDGNLWVGTEDSGLTRIANGRVETLGEREGLTQNHVRSIYEDREGNLWVGTNGGLNQLRDSKVTAYTSQDGLSHDYARVITETRDGSIWIGTDGGGASRFRDGTFTTFSVEAGLGSRSVRALCESRDGSLWLGTRNGLDRFDGTKFTHITTADGLPSNLLRAVLEDRSGDVWIAGETGGLARLHEGRITVLTTRDGLANDRVRALFEDRQGNLWIGTYGGLCRLRNGRFTTYRKADGLANDLVFAVAEDASGNLWIGTDGGLSLLRGGRLVSYTMKVGLADDTVFTLLQDDAGYLWMSSNRGISRVAFAELLAFAEGRATRIQAQAFDKSDGMRANQCNGVSQPAGWKTRSGELWFPTVKGVVRIDPANLRVNPLPPPVLLERVLVDNKAVDPRVVAEVTPGRKKLEIGYAALSYIAPDRIRCRYRLDPFDPDWIDAGNRRTAYYTNIPPGEYRFRVTACNSDGVWNETGASWSFRVPTPPLRSWWAFLLYALGLTGLVWGLVKLRLRGLARQNFLLEETIRERTAEVQLGKTQVEEANRVLADKVRELEASERRARESEEQAHEANRAKSVFLSNMSHELRTPLNSIIGFASILTDKLHDRIDARQEKFLRNILASGQHLLRLIHDLLDLAKIESGRMELFPEVFYLKDVVDSVHNVMRGVAAEQSIAIEIDIPESIPPITGDPVRVKQILFNLLSNAVKFSPRGSSVAVRASRLDASRSPLAVDTVRIDVVDHGIGIRKEDLAVIFEEFRQVDESSGRRYEGSGLGLALVRKLLDLHGGQVQVESELDKGSTFSAFLPVMGRALERPAMLEPTPVQGAARSRDGGGLPARPKRRTVLVVEDDPVAFHTLASALETEGYAVIGARNGEQALQLVDRTRPDLITLDIILPGLGGWDVLKELRARAQTAGTPVVIVTMLEKSELATAMGADAYFNKPVERGEFLDRIRELAPLRPEHGRPGRILVIDDQSEVHEILTDALEPVGYSLLRATNGERGLELARQENPDLVVLDLLMPGMTGFEVAFRLRADSRTAGIPIIVCTAKELTSSDHAMLSGRIATLIPKGPDSIPRLTAAIRSLLGPRPARTGDEATPAAVPPG